MYLKFIITLLLTTSSIISQNIIEWEKLKGPPSGTINAIALDTSGGVYLGTAESSKLFYSGDNGDSWSILSNYRKEAETNAIFINDSNEIYVAYDGLVPILVKSSNNGNTWEDISGGQMFGGKSLAVVSNDIIFVGSWGYYYKTINGGQTWERLSNLNISTKINLFAIIDSIVLATGDGKNFISNDLGENWKLIDQLGNKTLINVFKNDTNHTIAATLNKIFISEDYGNNWVDRSPELGDELIYSATKGENNSIYIMTYNGSFFQSENYGLNWTKKELSFYGLLKYSTKSKILYCATKFGLVYKSNDYGATWEQIDPGINFIGYNSWPAKIQPIKNSNLLFANLGKCGIYRSTDKGETWNFVNGLPSDNNISMTKSSNGNVYSAGDNKIYISSNNGLNWEELASFTGSEIGLYSYENILFSYIANSINKSTDNGITWTKSLFQNKVITITEQNGILYGIEGKYENYNLIISADLGDNWQKIKVADLGFGANSISVTSDSKILVYSDEGGDDSRIWRSTDTGKTWQSAYYTGFKIVGLSTFGKEAYAALKGRGVLVSQNNTNNWKVYYSVGLTNEYSISFAIDNDGYFYQSTYSGWDDWFEGGLFKSKEILVNISESITNKKLVNSYSLSQNYPNPFNPSTLIKYTIPTPPASSPLAKGRTEVGFVTLKVFNILGKEVATLVNKKQDAGNYQVEFEGNNLPSGVYFYRLQTGEFVETKKMLLLR